MKSKNLAQYFEGGITPAINAMLDGIPPSGNKLLFQTGWTITLIAYHMFAGLYKSEADEFLIEIKSHIQQIGELLFDEKDFQQSLAITFEALQRTRDQKKRDIIKNIFILGYVNTYNRDNVYLERLYRITQEISIDGIEYIIFLDQKIIPMKSEAIQREVSRMDKKNRDRDDEWWFKHLYEKYPESTYIEEYMYNEYSPTGEKLKDYFISKDVHDIEYQRQWDKEKEIRNNYHEIMAELSSLGIIRSMDSSPNSMGYSKIIYRLNKFGYQYVKYLKLEFK